MRCARIEKIHFKIGTNYGNSLSPAVKIEEYTWFESIPCEMKSWEVSQEHQSDDKFFGLFISFSKNQWRMKIFMLLGIMHLSAAQALRDKRNFNLKPFLFHLDAFRIHYTSPFIRFSKRTNTLQINMRKFYQIIFCFILFSYLSISK